MQKAWALVILYLMLVFSIFCSTTSYSATDGVYIVSETAVAWDGTFADRLKTPTADYDHAYGDEASLTYTLPWPFAFYGQTYNQITADTNGNIWFGFTGAAHSIDLSTTGKGPVISVWNNDLSSQYYGGVFIQRKTGPERVVLQWQTETYTDEGSCLLNDSEAVLFPNGNIRFDYKSFNPSTAKDFGSGISLGDGTRSLNLTASIAPAPTLAGRSFLFFDVNHAPPVSSVTVSADKPSPKTVGAKITFTATASGGSGSYEYYFTYRNPVTATWSVGQAYGARSSWLWNTAGLPTGNYSVQVWARNAGSTAAYEAYKGLTYILNNPVAAVAVTTNPASPKTVGAKITFTATASGGSGSYEYYFTYRNPVTATWSVGQAYGARSSWLWNTTGLPAGNYSVQVWARNAGSTAAYEAYKGLTYILNNPVAAVTGNAILASLLQE